MQEVWRDRRQAFFEQLLRERVKKMVEQPQNLRDLRHNHKEVERLQRKLDKYLSEENTNMYKLVARAYGECWDSEDDEKKSYQSKQKHDDVASTCEKGARSGLHELQGEPEARKCLVEEAERKVGSSAEEESKTTPKEN